MKHTDKLIQSPFWSNIPFLKLRKYPQQFSDQVIFWASAIVYSFVYFFIIAFLVVVFTHSLWEWISLRISLQGYFTTTVYDIMYRHIPLVILFLAVEVYLIYRGTQQARAVVRIKKKSRAMKRFLMPLVYLGVIYILLKLMTGDFTLEPNVMPVLIIFYFIFFAAQELYYYSITL